MCLTTCCFRLTWQLFSTWILDGWAACWSNSSDVFRLETDDSEWLSRVSVRLHKLAGWRTEQLAWNQQLHQRGLCKRLAVARVYLERWKLSNANVLRVWIWHLKLHETSCNLLCWVVLMYNDTSTDVYTLTNFFHKLCRCGSESILHCPALLSLVLHAAERRPETTRLKKLASHMPTFLRYRHPVLCLFSHVLNGVA